MVLKTFVKSNATMEGDNCRNYKVRVRDVKQFCRHTVRLMKIRLTGGKDIKI